MHVPSSLPATLAATPAFDTALSHEPSDKRIEILRLIGETGSISEAARQAHVSYKAAWQAIDTLSNLSGVALLSRTVGGTGGGGATLTEAGQELLRVAQHLAAARQQVLMQALQPSAQGARARNPAPVGLRTSMRNQLPCQVQKLVREGQMVRVYLALAGGDTLVSRITQTSAELLDLHPQQAVLALCKATAVRVTTCPTQDAPDPPADLPAGQHALSGHVTRISLGDTGDEVSIQLTHGLQLVGFAAAGSQLAAQAPVRAVIDESAWVIALTD